MRNLSRSVLCTVLLAASLAASTNSFHGLIIKLTEDGFVVEQTWNSMGPRRKMRYGFVWKQMWRNPLYMLDGQIVDEASCKEAARVGARVVIELSRGKPTILHVMTEPMLPAPQPAASPLAGTVELRLAEAVDISQWGKRDRTAENWPMKPGTLQLNLDPAAKTAIAVLPEDFSHAPEVDISGLAIEEGGIKGTVTVTLLPAYTGETQEKRTVELTIDSVFGDEGITGTWTRGEATGTIAGKSWAPEPLPEKALLWAICPRGVVPGQDGKRNTMVIRLADGQAGKDDIEFLHYKGCFTVATIDEAAVTVQDGVVSGTITYTCRGTAGLVMTLDGRIVGHRVAIACTVAAPEGAEGPTLNRAAGMVWPAHPHAPSLMPPEKPKKKKKKR